MSYLLATLTALVLLNSEAFGKSVTGLFKSEAARQQRGQFITKFMYQGNTDLKMRTCHFCSDRLIFICL